MNIIEQLSLILAGIAIAVIISIPILMHSKRNKKIPTLEAIENQGIKQGTKAVPFFETTSTIRKSEKKRVKSRITSVITVIVILLLVVSVIGVFVFEENKLIAIQNEYDSLENTYNSLQSEHNSLTDNYNKLQTTYSSLQTKYNSLQSSYNALQSSFNSYKNTVEVRYGEGADCKKFITPNHPSVISATTTALKHSSDGDLSWDDMKTINNWVGANIKYNHDTFNGNYEECWLYPSETLSRGYGDCEDHALLMVSMCKAEGPAPWLWCSIIKLQDGGAHMCVFVKVVGGELFIFDPTDRPQYFFGWLIREAWNSGTSKPVYQALQQYQNECYNGQTITVLKIFNEETYYTFNSNQEFYNFWIN